jgi:hypothetical protein
MSVVLANVATLARLAAHVLEAFLQRHVIPSSECARAFSSAAAQHNATVRAQVPAGDIATALDFIVGMYESIGDALMRTLSQDGRVPVVTEMAEAGRVLHGEWLERVFGPLLSANPKRREEQLALLLIATDVFTWK